MHICIINSKFYPIIGGGETFTYQLAQGLHNLGHKVKVITSKLEKRDLKVFPFEVEEIENFTLETFRFKNTIPDLYKSIKDFSPEIIHIHDYFPYFVFHNIGHAFQKCNIIWSIHNTPLIPKRIFGDFQDYESEFFFAKNLLDNGCHNYVIAASKHYKEAIEILSSKKQNLIEIPYSVDTNIFSNKNQSNLRKEFNIQKNDVLILLPSRIIERKGIREAVESLKYLPNNYKLFVMGAAEPTDKLFFDDIIEYTNENKLKDRVIFPEIFYKYSDLPYIYPAADVVILPSYYEGFGIVLLESMATGVPVIGSDTFGINEVIKDMSNGLLVPMKEPAKLSQAIKRVIKDKDLRSNLINGGYKSVNNEFSIEKMLQAFLKIYKNKNDF